jgi:hypothetical protein
MSRLRAAALPLVGLLLVGGVLGIEVTNGGGAYTPRQPANPCAARTVRSHSTGIDGLTERLVLIALDKAACRLGISREALTLDLARHRITTADVEALRSGLLAAVAQMRDRGSLPPASALVDQALDRSDLNGFLKALIGAIPDSVIDAALKTDDVLTHVIDDLALRTVLAHLNDQNDLSKQIQAAVTRAVVESLVDRLRDLL